jgi:major membrane immunogen (membrane-anchored lipoprotein)
MLFFSNPAIPMLSQSHFAAKVLMLFALVLLSGCSSSDDGEVTVVKGKLLDNGKPFKLDDSKIQLPKGATAPPPGTEVLRIVFISKDDKEQFFAKYNAETSTFEVSGAKGRGIKAGKYKIAITANFSPNSRDVHSGDYFGDKFSREKTQILREVKSGEEITIDVANPKG